MRIRKEARIEFIHRFARGNYRRFRNRVCGHVELRAPRAQLVTGALGSSTEKKCLLYSIFKEQNFRPMGSNIFFGHAEEVSSFWLAAVRGTRVEDAGGTLWKWSGKCLQVAVLSLCRGRARSRMMVSLRRRVCNDAGSGLAG